jgi:hypothetical protein
MELLEVGAVMIPDIRDGVTIACIINFDRVHQLKFL